MSNNIFLVAELKRRNSELEDEVKALQEQINALVTINKALGDESDNQKQLIDDLQKQLAVTSEESGNGESEDENSELSSDQVESDEPPKKARRVQPSRKVKIMTKDESLEARVYIYFFIFELFTKYNRIVI